MVPPLLPNPNQKDNKLIQKNEPKNDHKKDHKNDHKNDVFYEAEIFGLSAWGNF